MYRSLAVMLRKYLIRIVPGLKSLASSRLRWPLEVISSSDFTTNTSTTLSNMVASIMLGRRPNHLRTSTFSV